MNGLNWHWIALELTVAPMVGVLVALPLWLNEQPIFGNIAGTIVIFGTAFGLILREHMQIEAMVEASASTTAFRAFRIRTRSRASPSTPSSRCSKSFCLFLYSLRVERKIRRRGYDPQWR